MGFAHVDGSTLLWEALGGPGPKEAGYGGRAHASDTRGGPLPTRCPVPFFGGKRGLFGSGRPCLCSRLETVG